jgi:Tfp pilus assembly protein PilX
MTRDIMHTNNERGIALMLALFLVTALSVLGASMMFLSQTETYASMNYRMMSQARYAAEAGVQKASSFILDPAQFTPPTAADLLGPGCDRTVSPVTCGGTEVILSASTAKASNYPVAAVQTSFNLAGQGTLAACPTTTNCNNMLTYSSYARLIALQTFDGYGGTSGVATTWEIIADGGLTASPKATVEIQAMIETPKVPASTYGAFGTDTMCGALTFGGNVTINSYDSTGLTGSGAPTMLTSGGDVGTNGNLTITGSVDVKGNLYTPRTGVGACSNGADGSGAIDGLTEGGSAQIEGSMVKLPAAVVYPSPILPGPSLLPAVSISSPDAGTCALLGLTALNCVASGGDTITLTGTNLTLPSISLTSHTKLVITASSPAAQINVNSISLAGGSSVGISATSSTQGAVLGIVGKNPDNSTIAAPVDFTGGTYTAVTGCASCSVFDASMLQMVYAGTGEIKMTGNSGAAATFYAPNALFTLSGTADIYGSVLAKRLDETGNGNIHYDQRLKHDFYVVGNPMMGTFNWKRF